MLVALTRTCTGVAGLGSPETETVGDGIAVLHRPVLEPRISHVRLRRSDQSPQ